MGKEKQLNRKHMIFTSNITILNWRNNCAIRFHIAPACQTYPTFKIIVTYLFNVLFISATWSSTQSFAYQAKLVYIISELCVIHIRGTLNSAIFIKGFQYVPSIWSRCCFYYASFLNVLKCLAYLVFFSMTFFLT